MGNSESYFISVDDLSSSAILLFSRPVISDLQPHGLQCASLLLSFAVTEEIANLCMFIE